MALVFCEVISMAQNNYIELKTYEILKLEKKDEN